MEAKLAKCGAEEQAEWDRVNCVDCVSDDWLGNDEDELMEPSEEE